MPPQTVEEARRRLGLPPEDGDPQGDLPDIRPGPFPGSFFVATRPHPDAAVVWELEFLPASVWDAMQGDGADSGLLAAELAEQRRSNLAREAIASRQIALDRALGSLSAYNAAQVSADQRRVAAMDQARQLAGLLVPKGTEFFPGLGPGSAMSQAMERGGLPFEPARVVEREFQPQALAQPPDVPPQIASMLQGLQAV